jgi:hypothetical protein
MALWLAQDSKPSATYASIERRSYQENTQLDEKQVVCQASYYDKDTTKILINRQGEKLMQEEHEH